MLRLVLLLLLAVLVIIPAWRIIGRTGLSPAWSILLAVPLLGFPVVALVVAYSRWPASAPQVLTFSTDPAEGPGPRVFALLPLWWISALISLWGSARVVRRAGFSPWWALLLLVPVVNIIMLWVFASARWPALPGSRPGGSRQDPLLPGAPSVS